MRSGALAAHDVSNARMILLLLDKALIGAPMGASVGEGDMFPLAIGQ